MEKWKRVLQEVKDNLEAERETGVIKRIYDGYGFVRVYPANEPRVDYFFHATDMKKGRFVLLEPGDVVSFKPGKEEKGPRAYDVRIEIESHLRPGKREVM